jgi:hypothetical protein
MITHDPAGNQDNFIVYAPIQEYNWGIVIQEPYDEVFAAYDTMTKTASGVELMLLAIDLLVCYLVFRFIESKRVAN